MIQSLYNLDLAVLKAVNQGLSDWHLDHLALFLSSTWLWVLVFFIFLLRGLRQKTFRRFAPLCAILAALVLSDLLCAYVIKPWVGRERPCVSEHDNVRIVVEQCGGRLGFPSNHAANGMAMTVVAWLLIDASSGIALLAFTLLVGLSRVYLAVHFPSDVLGGFVIGGLVGWGVGLGVCFLRSKRRLTQPGPR